MPGFQQWELSLLGVIDNSLVKRFEKIKFINIMVNSRFVINMLNPNLSYTIFMDHSIPSGGFGHFLSKFMMLSIKRHVFGKKTHSYVHSGIDLCRKGERYCCRGNSNDRHRCIFKAGYMYSLLRLVDSVL